MLERLFLAGTATCLLYLSLQFGQSPGTPNMQEQTASHVPIEHPMVEEHNHHFSNFTVAQK